MSSRWGNPVNNNLLRDKQGNLLPGGTVEFYETNTSTAKEVFSDQDLTVSLGSVLTADAFGLLPDFHLAQGDKYTVVAKDSEAITLWTRDGVGVWIGRSRPQYSTNQISAFPVDSLIGHSSFLL